MIVSKSDLKIEAKKTNMTERYIERYVKAMHAMNDNKKRRQKHFVQRRVDDQHS